MNSYSPKGVTGADIYFASLANLMPNLPFNKYNDVKNVAWPTLSILSSILGGGKESGKNQIIFFPHLFYFL